MRLAWRGFPPMERSVQSVRRDGQTRPARDPASAGWRSPMDRSTSRRSFPERSSRSSRVEAGARPLWPARHRYRCGIRQRRAGPSRRGDGVAKPVAEKISGLKARRQRIGGEVHHPQLTRVEPAGGVSHQRRLVLEALLNGAKPSLLGQGQQRKLRRPAYCSSEGALLEHCHEVV